MRSPWLDLLGSIIGTFGNAEVTLGVALGIAVARWRHASPGAIVPLFIVVTLVIEIVLKILIPHPAPPADRARTLELLPHISAPLAYSFPSGHLARVSFLAGIVDGVPLWLRVVAEMLMFVSHIYLGEHWLSDCLGGVALGLLVAAVARRVSPT